MAGGTEPSLPPGHPPIGAADPHGNLARGARAEGAQAGGVSGTVSVARTLKTGPSDVLYIIAKKGPATLAVQRIVQPSFPRAFEISGADAMTPGVGFEGPVDLVARLSKSGDAIPSKGDLEGIRRNVPVPAKGITVTIDTARH